MDSTNTLASSENSTLFSNYFADLASKQEISLLSNKISSIQNDLNALSFESSTTTISQFDTDQFMNSTATAMLNQQFFVWKNGTAGRMTVDTPFGFKEL